MAIRITLPATLALLLAVGTAFAQTGPWRGSKSDSRPAVRQPPPAPFQLTPQQEALLDRVLQAWEQRSKKVKTFSCKFTRWEFDPVFGPPDKANHVDQGQIKYGAPDRGMFRVTHTQNGDQMVRIDDQRAEHWICDGESIYEYNCTKKQLIERKLPPSLQGKAIADGPLPFLFGAEAEKLKRRYFLRIITPQNVQKEEIWLEAYPRFQKDAADFRRAQLILKAEHMQPFALQIHLPNGKNRTVYQFDEIVINDPLGFLKGNPFHALTPPFWKRIVEEAPAERVGRR